MKNLEHQDRAVKAFTPRDAFGLLWDCGTGKTRGVIKIAEAKAEASGGDKTVVVICPKTLEETWEQAVKTHSGKEYKVFLYDASKRSTQKYRKAFKEFLNG